VLVMVTDGPPPALAAALSLAAMLSVADWVATGGVLELPLAQALAASTRLASPAPSASRRRMGSVFSMRNLSSFAWAAG
jgi:hypothetical protein